MIRYCPTCGKEVQIKIKSMNDVREVNCPICKTHLTQEFGESRAKKQSTEAEEKIGNIFAGLARASYYFFLLCGALGIVAYFFHWDILLYIDTILCVLLFLAQYQEDIFFYGFGAVWILVGGAVGYLLFRTCRGVCLGIMVALMARHFFRYVVLRLVYWIINRISRLG